MKTIAQNKKAFHDYEILDKFEAGIALVGSEVKSIRAGRVSLKDSFVEVLNGEAFLMRCHVSPYEQAGAFNHEPERRRKLLMNAKERRRLVIKIQEKGLTLVPTRLYFKGGWAKVELALARGKRKHDKRETIATRDAERSLARARRGERE